MRKAKPIRVSPEFITVLNTFKVKLQSEDEKLGRGRRRYSDAEASKILSMKINKKLYDPNQIYRLMNQKKRRK